MSKVILAEDILRSIKSLTGEQLTEVIIAAEAYAKVAIKTDYVEDMISKSFKTLGSPSEGLSFLATVCGFILGYSAAQPGDGYLSSFSTSDDELSVALRKAIDDRRLAHALSALGLAPDKGTKDGQQAR